MLEALACGFANAKNISLHASIGSFGNYHGDLVEDEPDAFLTPYLTYSEAKLIGSIFYRFRYGVFNINAESVGMVGRPGRLKKLTLSTGRRKGRRRYVRDSFKKTEQVNNLTFDLLPPKRAGKDPALVHRELEEGEKIYQTTPERYVERYLQWLVRIAEKGPHRVSASKSSGEKSGPQRARENLLA